MMVAGAIAFSHDARGSAKLRKVRLSVERVVRSLHHASGPPGGTASEGDEGHAGADLSLLRRSACRHLNRTITCDHQTEMNAYLVHMFLFFRWESYVHHSAGLADSSNAADSDPIPWSSSTAFMDPHGLLLSSSDYLFLVGRMGLLRFSREAVATITDAATRDALLTELATAPSVVSPDDTCVSHPPAGREASGYGGPATRDASDGGQGSGTDAVVSQWPLVGTPSVESMFSLCAARDAAYLADQRARAVGARLKARAPTGGRISGISTLETGGGEGEAEVRGLSVVPSRASGRMSGMVSVQQMLLQEAACAGRWRRCFKRFGGSLSHCVFFCFVWSLFPIQFFSFSFLFQKIKGEVGIFVWFLICFIQTHSRSRALTGLNC